MQPAVPLVVAVVTMNENGARVMQVDEKGAALLDGALAVGDTVLVFSAKPYLMALPPEHAALHVPTAQHLVWSTTRTPPHPAELAVLLSEAETMVDEEAFSVPADTDQLAFEASFHGVVDEFPAVRRLDELTILFRDRVCPEAS